ncbi:AsmA family protein [Lutimaribacter sp. EGI FJ00015]|uniref:AsmA family protein n=1 Tax=Lutimaribacter degradans TaxID=2945989 RepID=A0ACC5ZT49_9RHOB|nr:AsmA family protein [Lutimaribacter sp. EGI FJ00013]MCM2561514.1 AsmA family protein [Lutimaribacter sp. EGI FJ00013]MCO0612775.1 AsmA family protein [Lutimaribacter sp. EGI FJ00015]MCO0635433.1 AsmA family protein [Lutimaribacter sp. EGI FJ00014]
MRWVFRVIGLVLVFAIVAVAMLFLLPGERIARIATSQIEAQTGRAVTLSGDTQVSFWPVLGVSTGKMALANADWSDSGPMMEADSLKVGVDMAALFGGSIRITGLEAENPVIRLETAADGRVNWQVGVEGVSPSGVDESTANPLALTLDRALITNATIRYTDGATRATSIYDNVDFDMQWPDAAGAADFVLRLRPPDGDTVEVTATVQNFAGLFEGEAQPMVARASLGGGSVSFDGQGGPGLFAQGALRAELPNTGAALAALGIGGVDIPRGLGRSVDLSARFDFNGTRAALDDLVLTLDNNRLNGDVAVALNDVPRVTGRLSAGALDLTSFSAADGAGAAPSPGSGWSKASIDASGLSAFDADLALAADSVDLGQFRLGQTRARVTNDRARAVVDITRIDAYGGQIAGDFVMNNRSGLSVGGRLRASGVDLQALLGDAVGITRFRATGDARVEFLGVGRSLNAIMRSLSGDGEISTGKGVINGIDLDRLMRGDMTTGGTTVFDETGATFTLAEGVLRNDDFSMALPFGRARGAGRVNLGAQTLNYTITPISLTARDGRGLAVPVRVRGPWADPNISIDLERAVRDNFDQEIEEKKDELRQRLEDRVTEELGNTPQEEGQGAEQEQGQSAEDAVKDKVEDELKRGLRKLFE